MTTNQLLVQMNRDVKAVLKGQAEENARSAAMEIRLEQLVNKIDESAVESGRAISIAQGIAADLRRRREEPNGNERTGAGIGLADPDDDEDAPTTAPWFKDLKVRSMAPPWEIAA